MTDTLVWDYSWTEPIMTDTLFGITLDRTYNVKYTCLELLMDRTYNDRYTCLGLLLDRTYNDRYNSRGNYYDYCNHLLPNIRIQGKRREMYTYDNITNMLFKFVKI